MWLRESPKLLGDNRDIEISQVSFQVNDIKYEFQQSFAEENLWLVRRTVDDVTLFGDRDSESRGLQTFRRTWKTSEPTWVGPGEPIQYCGLESRDQCSYIKEVLQRHSMEDVASTQVMKDGQEPEEELDKTQEQIKEAQQLATELLWLATKTRPDLGYGIRDPSKLFRNQQGTQVGEGGRISSDEACQWHSRSGTLAPT